MFALCFRPWTHTSDDSYIYPLSLGCSVASVSFFSALRGELDFLVLVSSRILLILLLSMSEFRRY